jgi:glycosyltransferase involved in cell wall biosynthesis
MRGQSTPILETPGTAHVLVYEPRTEGHHVSYLGFITEDLLAAGYQITLAIDTRAMPFQRIREQMAGLLRAVDTLSLSDLFGYRLGSRRSSSVADCLLKSGADLAFLPNFDEIASGMLRRAAFGIMPDPLLRGRLSGIYFRPRFLDIRRASANLCLKSVGFHRMLRAHWFNRLFLLDPYIFADLRSRIPDAPVFYLPDPYPNHFCANRECARREFGIAAGQCVFLLYGAAYRRKGTSLVVKAMESIPDHVPAVLLCAGELAADPTVSQRLANLTSAGKARVIARYVSIEEEKRLFSASDIVLLPYRKHWGSSGVLVRAVAAGHPVIASDEGLLARLVRDHDLGALFRSGHALELRDAIAAMAMTSDVERARWRAAAAAAAPRWSREAFRNALIGSFGELGTDVTRGL